jgi:hypothetical protein
VADGFLCTGCGASHQNYHSDVAHGLCPKCRDAAFEKMRKSWVCCRCGNVIKALTPARADAADKGRFLACSTCGLIIPRDRKDVVRGTQTVRA